MYTVVETPTFQRLWPKYWTEEERAEFAYWLASHPEIGDVVPESGGVRVIYFNHFANGQIWLLLMYAKNELATVAGYQLKELKNAIETTFKRSRISGMGR